MKEQRGSWWLDYPVWRSDHEPLHGGRSDRLGLRSDSVSLFQVQSDRPDALCNRQSWPTVESPTEYGALVEVWAWEPHRECHPAEKCLNH
jgi:hypothetical protein